MADIQGNKDDAKREQPLPTASNDYPQPGPSPTTTSPQSRKVQSSIGACDACRLRKVRCLANESSMSSKCQRCTRANRECIYTTHSKTRRRKRTDTRVKELEEKVRGLSMLLESKKSGSEQSSAERDIIESTELEDHNEGRSPHEIRTGSGFGEMTAGGFSPMGLPPTQLPLNESDAAGNSYGQNNDASYAQSRDYMDASSIFPDVVDRGVLSMEKATELYGRYVDYLMPLYPAVVVPPDCTAVKLRETRPVLFLAILAASAGASSPALNLRLNKEIQQIYATKVTIQGQKSMEILQSMLISILWTYPPDKFEDLKFHQQITQASTMALDLGLASKPRASVSAFRLQDAFITQHPGSPDGDGVPRPVLSPEKRLPDSSALESRRTLLACYAFCASVTMSLRLPNMLRFSNWMAEAVEVLEKSPHAAPTDKRFVAWVKMQRIVEESGTALSLDDPSEDNVSLADERVQAILRGCEKQLDTWRRNAMVDRDVMNSFLEITYYANTIYLHEIALHPDHDSADFRLPFFIAGKLPSSQSQTSLTPPYINATIQLISSADKLITTFLNMTVEEILQCPTLVYVRVVYATVVLIKLSISARMPASELGKILQPDSNKIETYLELLLAHFRAVSLSTPGGRNVISSKFLGIVMKLKLWCEHRKEQTALMKVTKQSDLKREPDSSQVIFDGPDEQATSALALDYDRVMRSNPWSSPLQNQQPLPQYELPPSDRRGFFGDFNKSPIISGPNQGSTQSLQPTSWSATYQTTVGYSQPPVAPYNFSMDADPSLFTHLVNADLDQSNQDNWMLDADSYNGMDYSSLPEFNWATWPQP